MRGEPAYRLRTLLIVLALGPPAIWGGWLAYDNIARAITRALLPVQQVQPIRRPADIVERTAIVLPDPIITGGRMPDEAFEFTSPQGEADGAVYFPSPLFAEPQPNAP